VRILGRLAAAVDLAERDSSLMENQLRRMRDRTSAGVDVDGVPFAPYSRPDPDGRLVPLGGGAKLIEGAKVGVATSLDGADLTATIDGEAGAIASAQNRLRHFVGYSDDDRQAIMSEFRAAIARNLR
jgi:hypothetical protein